MSNAVSLSEGLLLQAAVDDEFRAYLEEMHEKEMLNNLSSVAPQDITFVSLVQDVQDYLPAASDQCRCTCISTMTWKCDGTTL
jgi:hypothetical protein